MVFLQKKKEKKKKNSQWFHLLSFCTLEPQTRNSTQVFWFEIE